MEGFFSLYLLTSTSEHLYQYISIFFKAVSVSFFFPNIILPNITICKKYFKNPHCMVKVDMKNNFTFFRKTLFLNRLYQLVNVEKHNIHHKSVNWDESLRGRIP
jgi:hypothetical protein